MTGLGTYLLKLTSSDTRIGCPNSQTYTSQEKTEPELLPSKEAQT